MRVSSLLVLSLVLVFNTVSSAPVEKPSEDDKNEEVVEVAKRDQETIMFGNQQNEPRVMTKKSDPEVPVIAVDNTLDKQGFIEAKPEAGDGQEETALETDDNQDQAAESAEAELPPIKQQVPEDSGEENSEEESEPVADADSVEEELKGIMADDEAKEEAAAEEEGAPAASEEGAEEVLSEGPSEETETDSDTVVPSESEDGTAVAEESEDEIPETEMVPSEPADDNSLMDLYYYMLENEKPRDEPQPRDYYYDLSYYPYRRRRSSRRARAVTEGDMTHNDLQRSKRIKRDLLDDEIYYTPYEEEAEPELSDEDLYELYGIEPKYEDEVATLLDMYQQAPEEVQYEPYEPYQVEEVYPEELYEELEEAEEPEYVPSKRQMMSSLPGIKKRYFYPFNREPQTHWGAFIPEQKRDYDQAYRRLLALASALSEESPYYQVYRKK